MSNVVETVEQPLFIKRTHELNPLLRKIKAGSAKAVDVLIETMEDKDTEPKLKVACATALIEYEVKITDLISKDQITRQVAEIKAKGLVTPLSADDPLPLPPAIDFANIQEV